MNDKVYGKVVTDNKHLVDRLEPLARGLDAWLAQATCHDWQIQACAHGDATLRWVFVDLHNPAAWISLLALGEMRDKLRRRGVALIGLVEGGLRIAHAATRELVDEIVCLPESNWGPTIAKLLSVTKRTSRCGDDSLVSPRVLETPHFRLATRSPNVFPLIDFVDKAANLDLNILLVGETGTGKTTLAGLMHELSDRRNEPFVTVACGAISHDLIGSDLFGHERGAYTSAEGAKVGKFTLARGGTLLLDEIDVLGLDHQSKLLRVLESGEYEPLGANKPLQSHARVIVATNRELEPLIAKGAFRHDLYFRLNHFKIEIPPLRRRTPDIVPLAIQFIGLASSKFAVNVDRIHPDFFAALEAYPWPGNIRELKNEMERSLMFVRNGVLDPSALNACVQKAAEGVHDAGPVFNTALASELAVTEQQAIERMLRTHKFNRSATARALGISRVTLYNKIRKYRIRNESIDQEQGDDE